MAPQTRNQGNHHKNESGRAGENPAPNRNPETLAALVAQIVDLLKMGANANRGASKDGAEPRGCTFEQFNKQHPLSSKDFQMRWLQKIGFYRWRSLWKSCVVRTNKRFAMLLSS
jgi:hypothetical protein